MVSADKSLPDIVQFVRQRDYICYGNLGRGACGQTVLLYDDQIDQHFVCKKFRPYSEFERENLYINFLREIKILHQVQHVNVVRIFNYFLYPEALTGYIVMEYIDGADIQDFVQSHPEQVNELFLQAISGFRYLESKEILHRDIRPGNLMVGSDGRLKIIDLGFGKRIENVDDFDKSVSLNWWCSRPPGEFAQNRYDFGTEVYFIGKLFARLIDELKLEKFAFQAILDKMCFEDPEKRFPSFADVEQTINTKPFAGIEFDHKQVEVYRTFSSLLNYHFVKFDGSVKYRDDIDLIELELNNVYRTVMLEENIPCFTQIAKCFLTGQYYHRSKGFPVESLKDFIGLLRHSSIEQKKIIFGNLHTMMDAITRYQEDNEDVPF